MWHERACERNDKHSRACERNDKHSRACERNDKHSRACERNDKRAASETKRDTASTFDLDRVLREIDDEVRARRASGDFPPGFERDLDLIFARFAPAAASGDDLEALLAAADRASFIDVDVPTASDKRGVAPIKKGLRKLQAWYLRYLAQQVSAFAASTVSSLRLLAERVEALEAATPGASPVVLDELRHLPATASAGEAEDAALAHVAGQAGRVALVESGDGSLLRRLVDGGLDAYGVEPRPDAADVAGTAGLEIRPDETLVHLRDVAESALGGLVLVGCPDRLPLGAQVELADLAAHVLGDGGRLALVGTPPDLWGRDDPVLADLSPGRPLHAATWVHLLERRGFVSVSVQAGSSRYAVTATRHRQ